MQKKNLVIFRLFHESNLPEVRIFLDYLHHCFSGRWIDRCDWVYHPTPEWYWLKTCCHSFSKVQLNKPTNNGNCKFHPSAEFIKWMMLLTRLPSLLRIYWFATVGCRPPGMVYLVEYRHSWGAPNPCPFFILQSREVRTWFWYTGQLPGVSFLKMYLLKSFFDFTFKFHLPVI